MATDTRIQHETQTAPHACSGRWYRPLVDLQEQNGELVLVADMPGAAADQIDIDFEDGLLTIEGRAATRHSQDTKFLLREYGVGDYRRQFRLSEAIDPQGIHAEYRDGVLTVHLPRAEATKPRKIAVKAGA